MFSDKFIVNVISKSMMYTPVYSKIIMDTPVCSKLMMDTPVCRNCILFRQWLKCKCKRF